jgi:hypothetical protein
MTQYEDKAAATLLALKDYARDLEADLGKIERNRVPSNPNFGDVQPLVEPLTSISGLPAGENAIVRRRVLTEYISNASVALHWVGMRDGLTGPELAARTAVKTLVASIQAINSRADAATLIATF